MSQGLIFLKRLLTIRPSQLQYLRVNHVSGQPVPQFRQFSVGIPLSDSEKTSEEGVVESEEVVKKKTIENIPFETSIKYLKSKAYSITYGQDPVWKIYRRNHKGAIPPKKTRKTCIRQGAIATGSPCPICRDEYLVLHPENVELLNQFISPHTGAVLSYSVTGLCQKRHRELLNAIGLAKDRGLITYDVPFRTYDYSDYVKN